MLIRHCETKDIPGILRLTEDSYTPYSDSVRGGVPSYSREELETLLNSGKSDILIAEDNGVMVGMSAGTEFGPCAYHVKMLFVSGKNQCRGIGSELLLSMERRAKERGFSLLTLNCLDWAEWSMRFYLKHGYREYQQEDELICPGLREQAGFLRKIGRLNNNRKHLLWKMINGEGS